MHEIEFMKDLAKNRRDILIQVYEIKQQVELLLKKDFFKDLLTFYQWMETLNGMPDWMFLYSSYLLQQENDEECDDCLSGKMRLLEALLFQLNEGNIFAKIKELNRKMEYHEELKSYDF